jgi:hypothetical protein
MIDLNRGSGQRQPTPAEAVRGAVDAALAARAAAAPPRNYLGASRLGAPCARQLQFEFLATPRDPGAELDGRLARIFERGHRTEEMAAGWLRAAGFNLRTAARDGTQFGFATAGGRIRGHIDGAIVGAPVRLGDFAPTPAAPALWECKALNARSWSDLVRRKLRAARPTYAGQVALYQAYMNLTETPALFTAVNADTMQLHVELVPFDAELAQRLSDRGLTILAACDAREWLPPLSRDRDHPECLRCPWAARCREISP